MKILVLNSGSSSIKYSLFEDEKELCKGIVDRIGEEGKTILVHNNKQQHISAKTQREAIDLIIKNLRKTNAIEHYKEIAAVGHRVVHGGSEFEKPALINAGMISTISKLKNLAPLHNPHNLEGIEAASKLLNNAKQMAVFDTAFHSTIDEKASTYALPYKLMEKYKIKRYGFHGINHKYCAEEASKILKKDIKKLKIITCHLGNGCSIAAVNSGKSAETSMGFTPLEGLVMGTRCGDVDPSIITFLFEQELLAVDELEELMNKKSGLLGISGKSNDVRDLIKSKDKRCRLALDVFCHRVTKYIGAYAAVMNGADAIVFSGGIGENANILREKILENFSYLGLKLNKSNNKKNKTIISENKSKVKVLVIPANEDLMIAREVLRILK